MTWSVRSQSYLLGVPCSPINSATIERVGVSRKCEIDLQVLHLSLPMNSACLLEGSNTLCLHGTFSKAQEDLDDLAMNL